MELVSIIIPTYNSSNTLHQALQSVVNQSYRPLQIIMVDDHSTDDTHTIAQSFAQQHHSDQMQVICLRNQRNLGAGRSRNKAVQKATGDYIAFLDADDLWKPHKLTTQLQIMKSNQASVCYSAYNIFTHDPAQPVAIHHVFKKLTYNKLLKANYIGNLTGIYHAASLGKIQIPELRKRQDWAMWLDILKKSGSAVGVQEPLASYRLGTGISKNKWSLIKYNFAVYNSHLNYGLIKSIWCMICFLYEQFVVKKALVTAIKK